MEIQIAVGSAVEQTLRQTGVTVPSPVLCTALIDTGATGSVVQQGIPARLGLNPIGTVQISTPSSANVRCFEYYIRYLFPQNVTIEGTVIEAPLAGQPIQCLIGRDILANAVLIYMGYANQFTLSF